MKRTGLILGLAIIVISNVIALVGVSVNRSGAPVQTIELTERELLMQPRDKEDSSIRLRLAWRRSAYQFFPRLASYDFQFDFPFDRAKLQELGFDCSADTPKDPGYRQPPLREAYVVLEHEGKAWEQWQQNLPADAQTAPAPATAPAFAGPARPFESLEGTHREGTRLFVADASKDEEALRRKYPDPRRHLIVRALVNSVLVGGPNPRTGVDRPYQWGGYVEQVRPPEIHVPLPYSRELAGLSPQQGGAPRYSVTLHYGHNLEPWIADVKLLNR
jgi:hypothetical protein